MTLLEIAKSEGYFDYWPWMSNKPHEEPDGNTLLYTSILHYLSYTRGELLKADALVWLEAINKCFEEPGVLNRGYGRQDFQAHDDYVGVCLFSHFCLVMDTENPAFKIVSHGVRSGWIYNNKKQSKDDFRGYHGRFLSVVAHYKASAKFQITYYEQLLSALDIIWSAYMKRDNMSGKIQDWCKCEVLEGKYLFPTIAAIIFNKRVDMAKVFGVYFTENHPFARNFRGEI